MYYITVLKEDFTLTPSCFGEAADEVYHTLCIEDCFNEARKKMSNKFKKIPGTTRTLAQARSYFKTYTFQT